MIAYTSQLALCGLLAYVMESRRPATKVFRRAVSGSDAWSPVGRGHVDGSFFDLNHDALSGELAGLIGRLNGRFKRAVDARDQLGSGRS